MQEEENIYLSLMKTFSDVKLMMKRQFDVYNKTKKNVKNYEFKMNLNKNQLITVNGHPHTKRIILADVNIPYKFSIDRERNKLIFCINADEFSDQSFQSVILDLNSDVARIVPGIRNGFASAVDYRTGEVYIGGSDGIYKYNYQHADIEKPAVVNDIDVFDMFYSNELYYVDTTHLDLHVLKNNNNSIVRSVEDYGIHHFAIDSNENLIFVNPTGLYILQKGSEMPERLPANLYNIRGVTVDVHGSPYVISQNGIYSVDVESKMLSNIVILKSGYGLAFDRYNNIVYGEERFVAKLTPL